MEKKKAYKSVPQNLLWCLQKQLCYAPSVIFMQVGRMLVNVGLNWASIYLPALVVAEVTGKQTLSHAALTVGALMLAILLGNMVKDLLFYLVLSKQSFYRHGVTCELNKKSLNFLYQIYERKDMRDLFDRALRASWRALGSENTIRDMPTQAWNILENIICYFLFGTVISFISPWLILVLTLAPAVNWFCVRAYNNWVHHNLSTETDLRSKLWYIPGEAEKFPIAKDIRIYGMAEWFKNIYHQLFDQYYRFAKKADNLYFLSHSADFVVILLRDGLAYALLIAMVLRGEMTIDRFVFCFAAVSSFSKWVGGILDNWNDVHHLSLSVCDLREYLEYPEEDGSGEEKVDRHLSKPPEITFDHVSFRYNGAAEDTIHDLSFSIRPGEKIAMVGLNGAGKTTVVKLLCGLYFPTEGEIRINGIPTTHFLRKDYYRLFSPVFQDVKAAFFSLAETVSCTSEEQTDFALAQRCMEIAGLGEKLASLPQGIHTKLDKQLHKDGIELSGGELQKLMLARALYKNAPVLVLDEPTTALDPIAENEIYLQYNRMTQGKTSLFISHRLASTRFCNRIFYLKNGRIAEEGTHEALLAAKGEYSKLYEMQSCWYQKKEEATKHDLI